MSSRAFDLWLPTNVQMISWAAETKDRCANIHGNWSFGCWDNSVRTKGVDWPAASLPLVSVNKTLNATSVMILFHQCNSRSPCFYGGFCVAKITMCAVLWHTSRFAPVHRYIHCFQYMYRTNWIFGKRKKMQIWIQLLMELDHYEFKSELSNPNCFQTVVVLRNQSVTFYCCELPWKGQHVIWFRN